MMKSKPLLRPLLMALLCVAAGLMVSCTINEHKEDTENEGLLEVGTIAPDFLFTDEGSQQTMRLSDFRGVRVVLLFWASWCPDCQREMPAVKRLYNTYADEQTVFIGVSFDTDSEAWRQYIADNALNWLQYSELKPWNECTLASAYRVNWIPTLYLVDASGRIAVATIDVGEMERWLSSHAKH